MVMAVDQNRPTSQQSARTGPITRFVWHHQASTNDDATIDMMVTGSREVSANFTVGNDNPDGRGYSRITQVVPDNMRAWTSDSQMVDGQALTAEVANSSGNPTWGIADETHEACARLAAYAFEVYGVPLRRITSSADGSGHIGHRDIPSVWPGQGYSTFCPGNLDIDRILARAAQMVGGGLSSDPIGEDDMPFSKEDLISFAQAGTAAALRSEGVSGAADLVPRQLADGSWSHGSQMQALIISSVGHVLRSEGVSGAGDMGRLIAALKEGGALAGDVDEAAIATSLAPLLTASIGHLTDADISAVAKATADEAAKRLAS